MICLMHTASKAESQDSNPVLGIPKTLVLSHMIQLLLQVWDL